jgi:hypothetical protein
MAGTLSEKGDTSQGAFAGKVGFANPEGWPRFERT